MRLIFIRHGQAENATPTTVDAHRVLTAKGRERLENVYPALARYLNSKDTVKFGPRQRHAPWKPPTCSVVTCPV